MRFITSLKNDWKKSPKCTRAAVILWATAATMSTAISIYGFVQVWIAYADIKRSEQAIEGGDVIPYFVSMLGHAVTIFALAVALVVLFASLVYLFITRQVLKGSSAARTVGTVCCFVSPAALYLGIPALIWVLPGVAGTVALWLPSSNRYFEPRDNSSSDPVEAFTVI